MHCKDAEKSPTRARSLSTILGQLNAALWLNFSLQVHEDETNKHLQDLFK